MGTRLKQKLPTVNNKWIALCEWTLIFAALALFTITETYQSYITIGLSLLAIFFAERGVRGKLVSAKTGLELPILLFVVSAGLAVWNAFNQETALLQYARILASVAIFFAITDNQEPFTEIVAIGFITAASVLAIYWPMKNDFNQYPAKFEILNAIGHWINAHFAAPLGPEIHANVAAGTLLVSLPFGAALTLQNIRGKNIFAAVLVGWLTLIVLAGLLMTGSRGAWLGLIGMIALMILAVVQKRWFWEKHHKRIFWSGVFLAGVFFLAVILLTGNLEKLLGQIPGPVGTMQSRIVLWGEGLGLIRDYFFTGSGLQTYWMVNAAYALLIHVPFVAHSHNSVLEIWIEQGFFGAFAVLWGSLIIFKWGWEAIDKKNIPLLGWAGLFALIGAGIHGMVDVVFYFERTLPIIGLLLGFAALIQNKQDETDKIRSKTGSIMHSAAVLVLSALAITGIIFLHPIASAWYANLGALSQTQIELSRYDPAHFGNLTLDQVRQTSDLSKAEMMFNKSLAYRANNLTSLQRLSEIEMARGDHQNALIHMQTAWNSGKRDTVTRLLYADALIANERIDEGVGVIRGLTWAEDRLLFQAWYRYWSNQNYPMAANFWKAALTLDPSNQDAANNLANVQKFLNP